MAYKKTKIAAGILSGLYLFSMVPNRGRKEKMKVFEK